MLKKLYSILEEQLMRFQYTSAEVIRQRGGYVAPGVFIGKDVYIDRDYAFLLRIDEGAVVSARTVIELHDSSIPNVKGSGLLKVGRVHICKRAYIGAGSVILPGVRIGEGAIVGALSLVNTRIPDHEVWGGVPVRFICTVDELECKRKTDNNKLNIAYFDWMGEPEKQGMDYEQMKDQFLSDVRHFFDSSGQNRE
jgi:maltose O-acetyltransferase